MHSRTLPTLVVAFALAFALAGCGNEPPLEEASLPGSEGESGATTPAPVTRELVFDREFLFISTASDPVVAIPWFFRSRSQVGGVLRERNAWIQRGGTWESLVQESEAGPTSRTPWRILPGENLRLIVGDDDGVDALLLRDGSVELETRLVDFLAEWPRQVGDPVRLFAGRSLFPSGPVDGYVLDLPRRWEAPGEAPGDWIFLLNGADLQLLLEEMPSPSDSRVPTRYRGWSHSRLGDGEWSNLTVQWEDMRPFELARRNIPSRWGISSPGGEISGELVSVNSFLSAGEGEGPILPVSGLFGVTGTLRVQGNPVSVVGVVRHVQR